MRIFMLGWEFPPHITGGLGTACHGLAKALSDAGMEIEFVLPRLGDGTISATESASWHVRQEMPGVTFRPIDVELAPYRSIRPGHGDADPAHVGDWERPVYSEDLFDNVDRYARLACEVADDVGEFDVIHAHDWMTIPAALKVLERRDKPLVVQIHSTEFDRSMGSANPRICEIERMGCLRATRVIAVSMMTKKILARRYWVPPRKIDVVYNAVRDAPADVPPPSSLGRREKIVLFLGRITGQKGPEYFLAAAAKVLGVMQDVRFVMAGGGDRATGMMELASRLGIKDKVAFTGFLRGDEVDRAYRAADLYVMPSVSDPFGISPLEALTHEVPAIISRQSGVAEVLNHVLKVDFWDTKDLANKIVAVLRHAPLRRALRKHGGQEARLLSWVDAGKKCVEVYKRAIAARR